MAVFLLFGILFLIILSFVYFDQDYLSPINVYLLYSLFSIVIMLFSYKEWNVEKYGELTTIVYLLGSFAFFLGCVGAKILSLRRVTYNNYRGKSRHLFRIDVGYLKTIIIIIICLSNIYGTYSYIGSVFPGLSLNTLGKAIDSVKFLNTQGLISGGESKKGLWVFLSTLVEPLATCSLFVIINNVVAHQLRKKDLLLLIPAFLFCLDRLLQGNRAGTINLIFAAIMFWFVSMRISGESRAKINGMLIKILLCIIMVFVPFFLGSLVFMGRYGSVKDVDIKNYISVYISGGVRNLDQYIKEPTDLPILWGEETFVDIHRYLYYKFGIGKLVRRYLEFRQINGKNIGNIYTSYRRFYNDFGLKGVFILPFIQGLIISYLYYNIFTCNRRNSVMFRDVFYCSFSYTTLYIIIDDLFYSYNISSSGIKRFIILIIVYYGIFIISSKRWGVIKVKMDNFNWRIRI